MPSEIDTIKAQLALQSIETPSWAYGNTGTRFKVFHGNGVARTPYEKIDDAAMVHRLTGVAPSIAIHIPWDQVDDYSKLATYAEENNIAIGAINPNVFQEDEYRLGSVCNPSEKVRQKAVNHILDCIDIAKETKSGHLSLWFADGSNYVGQDSIRSRQDRLAESLATVYSALPETMTLLLEYKFFEPAFYHTDVPDWGTSLVHCLALGPRAKVLVDTGHHAPGTNIEMIVAVLLRAERLGGFHFNSRYYADDDLMVGSADPFGLFRIMNEVVAGSALNGDVAFMLDQCHNIEPKVPAVIRSIMNVQEATAKALLVDRGALSEAQGRGDVLAAHEVLMDAFSHDVRPLLGEMREEMGLQKDPLRAYWSSDYQKRITAERATGQVAGWGA